MIAGRVVAIALGVVFVVAASAKLTDRPATARGFRALGFRATYPLAVAVPAVEALLAIVLVMSPRIGGLAAAALLVAFSVVLLDRLQRGITAPCNCFGSSDGRPLSARHLLRNAALVAAALLVAALCGWGFAPARWAVPGLGVLVAAVVVRLSLDPPSGRG